MPLAGEIIVAGQIPGERLATTIVTANSAPITTTETVVMTVIAPVVVGRIYRVVLDAGYDLTVSGDTFETHIREDSLAGTQLQQRQTTATSSDNLEPAHYGVEYTAIATQDKTFVATFGPRDSGTGSIILNAAASSPSYLFVDYIRA